MAYCAKCGKEVREGESFCGHCGARLVFQPAGSPGFLPEGQLTSEDYALFIGRNADKYLSKFRTFNRQGEDTFAATWHWPAFFVPFFWFLYRKLYLWALLVFVIGIIPYAGFIAMAAFGLTANYLYYKHAKRKLLEFKAAQPSADVQQAANIARTGGVNSLAVIIPLFLIPVIGILAAIAIPNFAAYRMRAYDMQARQELQRACNAATALFLSDPQRAEINMKDLEQTGFAQSPQIELTILNGTRDSLGMSAKHNKGKRTYAADRDCNVTEAIVDQQGTHMHDP